MSILFTITLTVHIIVGLAVIGLVLIQHGKGADMGAAFGSGASGSLFGATGSANFLSRSTAVLAAIFFITSLSLAYMASQRPAAAASSVTDTVKTESVVPVAPAPQQDAQEESKAKNIPK
ncbi:preprotein translocase subunit SecG [Sulfuricystis multivorans]|uniref:preprotein translocase subunit SecG n=1 Tax=Sulfuricystis multivorans TaxID=2211108 RepID=UPI000F825E29|nr:preprotein translocase subunit SecG [Sulfuricystis multivorans]